MEVEVNESGASRRQRVAVATLLAVVVATAGAAMAASPAGAQACDPIYGCTPSTPSTTPPNTSCRLDVTIVASGDVVDAFVVDAPANATIDITFDGEVAGSGTADAGGDAVIAFTVPPGIETGEHAVFAVGAGFSANCGTVFGSAVLSEGQTQTGAGADSAGADSAGVAGANAGRGGGSLARTGVEIGLLLAVAVVLVLVGNRLVQRARRRRRRAARRPGDVRALAGHR
jgi:hypothetical protein